MAYALRYYKTLPQPGDREIVLEIYEKDGAGASMEIGPVIQALHLDIQGSQEDIDTPVVKTSLVMTFVDAPDHEEASSKKCGNWEEFYTSDSTYWKVVLKKRMASGSFSPIWGGYVTPDSFTEQLRYRGSVTIVARDNIGHMQDFPFDSKGNEDGMITVYDLVNTAWAKIESPMSLNWRGEEDEAMWLQCDGHDVTGAYLNVSAFKGMNWYEAMEKVLYSIGAVVRYVGDNTVQVSSLRYMPYQGSASMSSLAEIEPKFIAHANRELVPAVRRIEESVKYDLVEDMQPLVSNEDFSGAVSDAAWGAYTAPVWPLINTASGNGWGNAVPSSAMYFNPQAYAIDEPPFLPAFEQAQEDIYNSMYLLCDAGQAMAEYSRGVAPANMSYHMRLGHTIQLYGSDTSGYVIVPSLAKIYRIRYAVKVTEANVEYFLQSDGSWSQDYAELEAYNDGNDCRELNGMLNLGQFSGGMVLHLYITGIESDAAGLAITYASVQMLSFAASEGEAYLQTNRINTANDESNNVILSHDPAFGPAYNLVALPGIIKNGMFIKSEDVYLPAKAWAWNGGTPQQMAVYNHLQLLCYHAKPNNVITGDIVNADLGNLRALYMWHGSEHLLQGGSLNFLNGRIEGAILREFARYDDMWGDVTGDSMPATEQESSTNVEEGGSSSGSSATYENTTNVTIGGSGGGSVTVDTFLSDTSTNPVQNRAIKAYVDSVDNQLEEKIGNLAERIDSLENGTSRGAGAVIFDATCATDPWNLNSDLQTETTLAEMVEAINNGSPIYMRFGNGGLVSVGYASIMNDGGVDMYVYITDAESHIVRTINVFTNAFGNWYWDGYESDLATRSYVEDQAKSLKKYADETAATAADDALTAVQQAPEVYVPLKTINGQSIYGAGDILISGGGGSVTETKYNLRFSAYSSQTLYVSRGEKAEIKFSFISQVMYVGTSAFVDTGEAGIVTISVKRPSDSSYQPVKTMTVPSNAVQTVDIAEYLGDGTNLVRISGEGETTGKTAENLAYTVIRSSLSIQASFEWWKPHTADTITVPYYVGGTIDKILHLTVTGPNGYSRSYSQALGTTPYLESVASIVIDHPGASGVYTLSAYVASTDGNFRTSELAVQTIFVTAGASGTYMAVNNVAELATNYAENAFFDFSVYNGGSASASVKFDIKKDGSSVYSTTLGSVATGTRQTFSAPLEISTSDSSDFSVSISATSGGAGLITPVSVQVDNSYSFAAFPGAVFFMNPKTRDNSQSNSNYIINEIDGSAVAATWSGMNWGSDGYQTVGGVKVLRIFAGSSVSINYQPFKTEAARTGKTIELDLLIDNVVDYEDAVLGIVKRLTSSWLGVSLTPEKMTVFSSLMSDGENQSFKFEDRTRLRITLVVMPDAYGNSGFNLVVMYVNGTKNREFTYANTDSFANDGDIVIGSDSADIDTYAVRVYDKALSSGAVHQNHVNLLDSIEEKKAFRDKNDVLAANGIDIDIEKVKKICNVIEFEGELPSLANPNKFRNTWRLYWRDNPEWNCVIRNILQDGQGTSAKLYREWNQRGKADGDTVTTYADGSTTTGAFVFMPGKPKIKTFTWKLNWASSCQCNKMGSVNSINDLCTALGILDPDGNPTAIYQRPFVGFQLTYDDSGNPIYTFVGLFTGGPDKGDPYWFNYDYDRYPDLISVEGADNASAGALFRVPWNPSAGRWQFNMDEESIQYNGINAFDYNAGKYETKADIQAHYERVWKPVYDFVYQCSPNIAHFDGTLAQLNAQVSALKDNDLEYWLDGGGLYYYESALGQYIPSDSGSGQMNLYDQLVDKGYGVTSAMISGLSADAVNTYLKVARATKFRLEADRYFNVPQGRFAVNWNLVLGSTDTRTKNTYWTVRGLLSEGYRCTLFWDDTDTIGPFTNQGQDRKPYWAEVGDKYADGSPVWNGEQNRFYNLMELAFPDELADDMRSLLTVMAELGGMTTGNKSDQLFSFFHRYYFSQAQEYFPSALYNAAAKRLYENAKLVYGISYNNDTDPITQSLGDYYSGWKRWIKRRIQYIQSKYHWGDYSGASGDVISVRAAGQSISYQITPAIWMYPVIMNGTSPVRGERTEAGQVCNMTIELGDAADQQNTIKGVHYLQDIGAWHDKQVHGTLSIYGRMLRELHIGHPTADIVITITKLILGETPSMRLIDLRRVSTLTGILDLSSCTHLQTLHAQGTSLTSVTFPNGGPLASVGFPATMQQIFLKNFPKLYNSGVDISECKAGITDYMVVGCDAMKPLALLAEIMQSQASQGASHALKRIRATGINETYNSSEILSTLVNLTDGTYAGLDADGVGGSVTNPYLEGSVYIAGTASGKDITFLNEKFPALAVSADIMMEYAIDKMFLPETTSDTSHIINTGYRLFSDEMPQWSLRINLSDIDYSKMPNLGTAVACANEAGAPYAGIHLARYASERRMKLDINPGNANIILTDTPPTIIIRRNGDILESSTNGGASYITRMASVASVVSASPRLATVPMIVGGYYDANGNVGRPFYGRVHLELYLEVIDFD